MPVPEQQHSGPAEPGPPGPEGLPDAGPEADGGAAAPGAGSGEDLSRSIRLLDRYRLEGDEGALDELMRRYHPRVLRKVRVLMSARVAARHDPEDIAQSVLRVGLEGLGAFEFREPAALIRWLTTIALNKVRSRARGRSLDEALVGLLPETSSGGEGPAEELLRSEAEALVDAAVARLSEDRREVILARDYDGGSWRYVAERLGRSPEACQMLHHRAKLDLRRLLRELDPGRDELA